MRVLKLLVVVFIVVSVAPSSALAGVKPVSPSRAELMAQIQLLIKEVKRLENILEARKKMSEPRQLTFFNRPFEAVYLLEKGILKPVSVTSVRWVDQTLFTLFTKIIGVEKVNTKVAEWRIFYDEDQDLGGFVELIPETGQWVIGINRAGYESGDERVLQSYIELFLHEYAHIVLFDNSTFVANYKKQFWTKADAAHSLSLEGVSEKKKWQLMETYYERNTERFVSEYATLTLDEDMAETFVSFVLGRNAGVIAAQKIEYFAMVAEFKGIQKELRKNISAYGLTLR